MKVDPWSNKCGRKELLITILCTEMATLNAGTCTRSRVITHLLDSSRRIHRAIHVEEKDNYQSVHRDGYTQCRHVHKEKGDNSLAGFMKADPWSNKFGRKG